MANRNQLELVAQVYRALTDLLPGFIQRSQQKQMITRTLGLLTTKNLGLVEAPTGTGKSMGYLIPGIVTAVTEDKVLVISTATASLQDQLASKDIPLALKAFESAGIHGIDVVIAKGRERYICPIKLDNFDILDMFASEDTKALEDITQAWKSEKWGGVRDDIPVQIQPKIWRKIANTSGSCKAQSCTSFDCCPYYKMQSEMKTARVIVTNHDYLLSMLSNTPGSIFSKSDKCLFIFDEAHHLSDKLLSAFARKMDLSHFLGDSIRHITNLAPVVASSIEFAAERIVGILRACENAALTLLGDTSMHRFTLGEVPEQFRALLDDLKSNLASLHDIVGQAKEALSSAPSKGVATDLTLGYIGQLVADVTESVLCIEEFTNNEQIARWISRSRTGVELRCSPFDGAQKARKHLWPTVKTGLLTSATFTSAGNFAPIQRTLGLPAETTPTLRLESPFNYARAKLVVPQNCLEATHPQHPKSISDFLQNHAIQAYEHQGILVYFTNKKLMLDCFDSIPPLQQRYILMQGIWQPWSMLAEHKKRIDAGERSIIFGLDSVGEGIDLPGRYCTRVIMTRLPFPSPDDPVLSTHAEVLKNKGKDPFNILIMPKAGLKFAQVAGRLMRRESDYGDFFVLDKRMLTKKYGQQLLKSTSFKTIEHS